MSKQLDHNTKMTEIFGGYTDPHVEAESFKKLSKEVLKCKTREQLAEFLDEVANDIECSVANLTGECDDR